VHAGPVVCLLAHCAVCQWVHSADVCHTEVGVAAACALAPSNSSHDVAVSPAHALSIITPLRTSAMVAAKVVVSVRVIMLLLMYVWDEIAFVL
jgi:hypothetical protein